MSGSHTGSLRPIAANFATSFGIEIIIPIALGILFWLAIPKLLAASIRTFLAVSVAFGWLFSMTLAMEGRGLSGMTATFTAAGNYWSQVPVVEQLGPRAFGAAYPNLFIHIYPLTHAAVHPPGALLFLWTLSRLTGGSAGISCAIIALIGVLGAVPTYLLARDAYGERAARGAALLFACSSGILLYAPTVDSIFVTFTAVALVALLRATRSDAWAIGAGVLSTVTLCFTFGALALAPLFLGMLLLARKDVPIWTLVRRASLVLAGVIVTAIAFRVALSINLIAIFRSVVDAMRHFDQFSGRLYRYWVWANPAALFISVGLGISALFAAETEVRWRLRSPGLESVLLATVVLLTVTGLNRGEADRVWLLLAPMICAVAAAAANELELRWVAAAGLAQALVMQCFLVVGGR
jgi:hypothetical protein